MLCKVTHHAGCVSANTRSHPLINCAGVTGKWGLLSQAQNAGISIQGYVGGSGGMLPKKML